MQAAAQAQAQAPGAGGVTAVNQCRCPAALYAAPNNFLETSV